MCYRYGQRLLNHDQVTFQDMMTAIFSLMLGALGLGQALIDLTDQTEGLVAARRIFRVIDAAAADPLSGMSRDGQIPESGCTGAIEIRDLTFSYPTRQGIDVCRAVTFSVSPGEVVAIVGPSGSGESLRTIRHSHEYVTVMLYRQINHYESVVAIL